MRSILLVAALLIARALSAQLDRSELIGEWHIDADSTAHARTHAGDLALGADGRFRLAFDGKAVFGSWSLEDSSLVMMRTDKNTDARRTEQEMAITLVEPLRFCFVLATEGQPLSRCFARTR